MWLGCPSGAWLRLPEVQSRAKPHGGAAPDPSDHLTLGSSLENWAEIFTSATTPAAAITFSSDPANSKNGTTSILILPGVREMPQLHDSQTCYPQHLQQLQQHTFSSAFLIQSMPGPSSIRFPTLLPPLLLNQPIPFPTLNTVRSFPLYLVPFLA